MEESQKDKEVFQDISAGTSKTFVIPIEMETDIRKYKGEFELRYPSVKDSIKIGVEAARLKEGFKTEQLDVDTRLLCYGLANLIVTCIRKPSWCDKFEDLEADVVLEIYTKYLDMKGFFRGHASRSNTENNESENSESTI